MIRPPNALGISETVEEAVRISDLISLDSHVGHDIRGLRKARSMTLEVLAKTTGLSQGYLSQIERGLASPSLKALYSISRALGVTVSWFFPPADGEDGELRDFVVRANAHRKLHYANGIVDELLSPNLDRQLEVLRCVLSPGTESGEAPYMHMGEEAGVILSGRLDLWINEKHITLYQGDSFAFSSSIPHRYANRGNEDAVIIWIITPPTY